MLARAPRQSKGATMRADIAPGGTFPDYELPDHTSVPRRLSELGVPHACLSVMGRSSCGPGHSNPAIDAPANRAPRIARAAHRLDRQHRARCRRPPRRNTHRRQRLVRRHTAPRLRQCGNDRRDLHPRCRAVRSTAAFDGVSVPVGKGLTCEQPERLSDPRGAQTEAGTGAQTRSASSTSRVA
jgi:hypothetical protein